MVLNTRSPRTYNLTVFSMVSAAAWTANIFNLQPFGGKAVAFRPLPRRREHAALIHQQRRAFLSVRVTTGAANMKNAVGAKSCLPHVANET